LYIFLQILIFTAFLTAKQEKMNYHLTFAIIVVFSIIIDNRNCNAGNASENGKIREARIQVKVPKIGELKPENVPIFINLMVNAFLGSPNCFRERKETTNFHVQNGKCLITGNGLKLLTEGNNSCKIQLQMSQLDTQDSLKQDLLLLAKKEGNKTLWDGYMTDWGHSSLKAIRRDLVSSILNKLKVNDF
jgi:hypothetical protein